LPTTPKSYNEYLKNLETAYANSNRLSDQATQNLYESSDYLEEDLSPKNNTFDPVQFLVEKNKEKAKLQTSSEDETIYGYQPPSWMPDWVKAGYQNSITGLTERVSKGQAIKEYDLNIMEDVGATLISFLQPLDFVSMAATGGVGGFAAKQVLKSGAKEALKKGLTKKAAKTIVSEKIEDKVAMQVLGNAPNKAIELMVKSGVDVNVARKAVQKAAPRLVQTASIKAAGGGAGLGFYSGLSTALFDKATTGDIDQVRALKEGLKGATLGALTQGTTPVVKSALKNLKPVTQEIAAKAVETAEFGTVAPLLSGEDINVEGYVHAAATIGGITAQKYALQSAKKGIQAIKSRKYDSVMDAETTARYLMEENLPDKKTKISNRNIIESNEVFVDRNGTKFDNFKFNDKRKEVSLRNVSTKEGGTINYDQFDQMLFKRSSKAKTVEGLRLGRNQKINNLKKQLKINDKKFDSYIETSRLTAIDPSKPKQKGLKSLNQIEQLKLLNELRHEKRIVELKNSLKAQGWEGDLLPTKRLTDDLMPSLPKFWRQSKNRISTQIGKLSLKDFDNADALHLTTLGDIIQQFNSAGSFKDSFFRRKKFKKIYEDLSYKIEDPRYGANGDKTLPDFARVRKIRQVFDNIWERATKAGIDLGAKEEFYFPHMIKPEYLKIFSSDIAKIAKDNPALTFDQTLSKNKNFQKLIKGYIENKNLNEFTISALNEMAGIKTSKPSRTVAETRTNNEKLAQAFYDLTNAVTPSYSSTAKNLEIARKGVKIPKTFMERDTRLVLARYANQVSRRIAFVETFGSKGEVVGSRISALRKQSAQERSLGNSKLSKVLDNEARTLDMLFKSYTNKIEVDPAYNWKTPEARKFWSDVVNFEIGTKIGLGFATIPNITQTFISTAIRTGYKPLIQATYKLATNPIVDKKKNLRYRDLIARSGVSNLSIFQMISGLEPTDSFFSRFADITTRASQFQRINQFNQLLGSAAAKEWIGALRKTANGKSALLDTGFKTPQLLGGKRLSRRQWAIDTLKELGISDYKKAPSEKQLFESMYKFSRDSQLQRNVLTEPLVMLDPRFRPFFLFKKFGYKQYNWIREQMQREVSRGNLFPMLRLATAGMAGGEFVGWARDALAEKISGQPVFDNNRYMFPYLLKNTPMSNVGADQYIDMSEFTIDDFVDRFASVGAFGVVGDIVANENKIRALEFAFKPALVQDLDKVWSAMTRTIQDTKDYGIGAALRLPKYLAPALGTVPRRALERLEPVGQRESYVKSRKGFERAKALDALIEGDSEKASRIINNYNRAFGAENPLTYEDYDADSITNRIINKIKKKEKNVIKPRF